MNVDEALQIAKKILIEDCSAYSEDLSETDTRCKLVDSLLVGSLGWQEHSIEREPHVTDPDGYIDYLLYVSRPSYVIEAKKRSLKFSLPSTKRGRAFKIGGVLSTDARLIKAIHQAKNYGLSKGTSFCCVTNGLQYVFFRAFSDQGIRFEDHQALIFDGADDIVSSFELFYSLLAFDSVSDARHLLALPVVEPDKVVGRFKELSGQSHSARYRDRNRLSPFIRDVVTEVFQDLADDDAAVELIEQCYVESASQGSYEHSLRELIKDKPTLAEGRVKPVRVSRKSAGKFDSVLDSAGSQRRSPEVAMILGGIGAGKTTFIKRFRKVIARERIDKYCLWLHIDFNNYDNILGGMGAWVASKIFEEAEKCEAIEFGGYSHLRQAYMSEYNRLKNGRLKPLFERDPAEFEVEYSKELGEFERDALQHVIRLLRVVQSQYGRRVFLIFDNADQYDASLQNDVFMLSQRLANEIGCSALLSLREESFWRNKDFGALSAFHGVSYYVEAPNLKQVLAKRFKYASDLLAEQLTYVVPSSGLGVTEQESVAVFESIRNTVLDDPRFVDFLARLSPGEVRRPLDQLARFLFSGHTNIDSILRGLRTRKPIRIGFHEFVKSVALSDREIFKEEKSDIVNLFALDGSHDASNLNRLALLGYLYRYRRDKSEKGLGYVPVESLLDACAAYGFTRESARTTMQFLNARRLLETDRQFREEVGSAFYVRTTDAFEYYLSVLGSEFVYVDLVLPGTLIPHGVDFDMIERLSRQIYSMGRDAPARIEKIELRIERAKKFAQFLADEASKHSMFRADGVVHESVREFVLNLETALDRQSVPILSNAKKVFAPSIRSRPG